MSAFPTPAAEAVKRLLWRLGSREDREWLMSVEPGIDQALGVPPPRDDPGCPDFRLAEVIQHLRDSKRLEFLGLPHEFLKTVNEVHLASGRPEFPSTRKVLSLLSLRLREHSTATMTNMGYGYVLEFNSHPRAHRQHRRRWEIRIR